MGYDASRPIPWRRLLREAAIYLVVASVAVALIVDRPSAGTYGGLVLGMLFYVLFVALLAKFGYERQSLRQLRERSRTEARHKAATPTTAQPVRQRPAPTRRTSTGPSQRPNRSTKKRRR
jgi:Ca2+/Na+ antiporter